MKISVTIRLLTAILFCTLAPKANAFIELKGGYSLLGTNPTAYNDANLVHEPVKQMQGLTADLLLNAAIMPINLGARYENFGFKKGSGVSAVEVEYQRISVILNKRFIDQIAYLGMVATVGLSNEFKDKLANTKASSSLSGSIGLETGLKFGIFIAGLEGGYLIAPLGDLKDSAGAPVMNAGSTEKIDMSGVYARAMVGLSF